MNNTIEAVALGLSFLIGTLPDKDPLIQNIHSKVMETIENSDNVPGLKAEEFKPLKTGIAEHWNTLVNKGVLEITATDAEVRPYFVAIQGIVEHVLSNELGKSVQSLTGVIHTPMPATPLCNNGKISSELVDPAIENDPSRLFVVKARTTILRDYLYKGGDLHSVYPEAGMSKRTEEQREIYRKELETYPVHLVDNPMSCESIEDSLTGAFYVFKNNEGKRFIFAIKMTQAKNPQDAASFGLWMDEYRKDTLAFERVMDVMNFVQQHVSKGINF